MTDIELFEYLQGLMPTLQFCAPFLKRSPLPPKGTNYAVFQLLSVDPVVWNQNEESTYDEETGKISVRYNQTKIYEVQLDFYGQSAFTNARLFQQTLCANLQKPNLPVGLKKMSTISNLTSMLSDENYYNRYMFKIELFIVDSIYLEEPAIDSATIKIVNRGNNKQ